MGPVDIIVIVVIAALVGLALFKIIRDKKKGVKCAGCGCGESSCCAHRQTLE